MFLNILKSKNILNIFIQRSLMKIFSQEKIRKIQIHMIKKNKYIYKIQSIVPKNKISLIIEDTALQWICSKYMDHRFDILGSGWISVGYNSKAIGIMNYFYDTKDIHITEKTDWLYEILSLKDAVIAENIYELIDKGYKPINWQRDFKCGYSWDVKRVIPTNETINSPLGADVKTCWDLGRMHHLVQLSIYALKNTHENDKYIREYRNHILDFIALNPVGKGIQWTSPMDAAIRASNILIAYDIFTQLDTNEIIDEKFIKIFSSSIYEHGLYIINNLEIDILHNRCNNHYLSNLVGLLYISAYLNKQGKSKKWWEFAKKEFLKEINNQFHEDGTNFEGSTSYHRLSGELLVFGAAILNRVDGNLSKNVINKLIKAGEFSLAIRKSNGNIIQIGDNDNGRLFKFSPQGEFITAFEAEKTYINLNDYCKLYNDKDFFNENFTNHDTFVSEITGLVDYSLFQKAKSIYPLESSIVEAISGCSPYINNSYHVNVNNYNGDINNLTYPSFGKGCYKIVTKVISKNINTINGKWEMFNDFGVCCYNSDNMDLFINIGRKKDNGINGHIHNDVLHIELCIDGQDVIVDPGTFVYTAIPEKRDEFRSYKAHFVPDYGIEPNKLNSLFSILKNQKCYINFLNIDSIECVSTFNDIIHHRVIEISLGIITITDYGNKRFRIASKPYNYYSNGYGRIIKRVNSDIVIISSSNF